MRMIEAVAMVEPAMGDVAWNLLAKMNNYL